MMSHAQHTGYLALPIAIEGSCGCACRGTGITTTFIDIAARVDIVAVIAKLITGIKQPVAIGQTETGLPVGGVVAGSPISATASHQGPLLGQ